MKKAENKNVYVVEMNNYVRPTYKETKRRNLQYISFGDSNDYPSYILDLYDNSAEHNAIINGKVDYVAGRGVKKEELPDEIINWMVDTDLEDIIFKITRDLEVFGGFAFKVIRTRDGEDIARLEWIDFSHVRVGFDEYEGSVFIADEWTKYKVKADELPLYDPDGNEPESVYFYTGNSRYHYPSPKYVGALNAIETDVEIGNFHLNSIKNGMLPSMAINFLNGIPSEEEQGVIEDEIRDKFGGSSNGGRFLVTFNDGEQSRVQIDTIESDDLDERFESLSDRVQAKIFIGHRITSPMLFGIRTPGQLGGRSELVEAYEIFKNTYVQPTQEEVIGVINDILSVNWSDIQLELDEMQPITERLSLVDIKENLTDDEIRESAGLQSRELSEIDQKIQRLSKMSPTLAQAIINSLSQQELMELYTGEPQPTTEITDEE